ncbi:MAG: hypothetical protein HY017_19720, partial [Betaproteobacteria bacterium]|nr:hypothetical protein [Betaproteobacteria bacterium]
TLMPLSNWKIEARTSAYVTALIAVPVLALGAWCMKVFGGSPEPALFYLGMLVCLPFVALGLLVPDLFTSSLYIPLSFFLSGLWLFLLVLGFRLLVAPLARRWRLARVAARFIGLAAGLAALSSLGWFAWWTDVPVSLRELKPVGGCTADAPGGAETFSPDKLGTFQVKWQGDNTALIETWVGHTILRRMVPRFG